MNNRYTNIGEAIVTSTVSGKAKIRVLQKRNFSSVVYWLVGAGALLLAVTWLVRGKAPAEVSVAAMSAEEQAGEQPKVAPAGVQVPAAGQPVNQLSPQQQARNEFHRAEQLAQQGKTSEAIEIYRASLLQDAGNDAARQAMVNLLLKVKRNADAERALQIGLKNNPKHSGYSMQLARLLADRNELPLALEVMQRTLPSAAGQADYQAFYASLLQRQNQHGEAITYYQKALGLKPGSGEWLMGMGISLKAAGRADEARDAFKHALETQTLSAQSRAFVEQQVTPP